MRLQPGCRRSTDRSGPPRPPGNSAPRSAGWSRRRRRFRSLADWRCVQLLPEVQVSVMFCGVSTPAVKVQGGRAGAGETGRIGAADREAGQRGRTDAESARRRRDDLAVADAAWRGDASEVDRPASTGRSSGGRAVGQSGPHRAASRATEYPEARTGRAASHGLGGLQIGAACRRAETQVSVMFCGVLTPALKVRIAALVRVKLAASAPPSVKLVNVVVPDTAPRRAWRRSGRCRSNRRWSHR